MSLSGIASVIRMDWKNVNYAAKPYLDAMSTLLTMDDVYGYDSAASVVAYLLSNCGSYRGEIARSVKAELKARLKKVYGR